MVVELWKAEWNYVEAQKSVPNFLSNWERAFEQISFISIGYFTQQTFFPLSKILLLFEENYFTHLFFLFRTLKDRLGFKIILLRVQLRITTMLFLLIIMFFFSVFFLLFVFLEFFFFKRSDVGGAIGVDTDVRLGYLYVSVANFEQLFEVFLTAFLDLDRVECVSKCKIVSHYNLLYQLLLILLKLTCQNICWISIISCVLLQI